MPRFRNTYDDRALDLELDWLRSEIESLKTRIAASGTGGTGTGIVPATPIPGATGPQGIPGIPGMAGPPGEDGSVDDFIYSPSTPEKKSITLTFCSAFTPVATGGDTAELDVPKINGQPVLWNVMTIFFRVATAGGAPSVTIEKYTGTGAFSPTTVGTVTLGSGANEGQTTSGFTTTQLTSWDKVRMNPVTLATALNWTVEMELTKA